jgi:hypothetical protein
MDARTQSGLIDDMEIWLAQNPDGGKAFELLESAVAIIDELRGELKTAQAELETAQDDLRDARNREDEDAADLDEKVSAFLDCVERPVGTLAPVVPPTPASQRAIIALYDAIGRNL